MLFITYYELNTDVSVQERLQAGQMLTSSEMFPPEGTELLRWDATPDDWGVAIFEADSAEAAQKAIGMWRAASSGFFKTTKTAPAMPVTEMMPIQGELLESIASQGQ